MKHLFAALAIALTLTACNTGHILAPEVETAPVSPRTADICSPDASPPCYPDPRPPAAAK